MEHLLRGVQIAEVHRHVAEPVQAVGDSEGPGRHPLAERQGAEEQVFRGGQVALHPGDLAEPVQALDQSGRAGRPLLPDRPGPLVERPRRLQVAALPRRIPQSLRLSGDSQGSAPAARPIRLSRRPVQRPDRFLGRLAGGPVQQGLNGSRHPCRRRRRGTGPQAARQSERQCQDQ